MTIGADAPLTLLRQDFLRSSSTSMPIVGTLYWLAVLASSFVMDANAVAYVVLIGSGMILPGGLLLDRLRGHSQANPVSKSTPLFGMFIRGTAAVALLWPLVIIAAQAARDPAIIVLGGAVLMSLVWIPYGTAADDPVGMQHAVGRSVACYLAFLFAPDGWTIPAICLVVIASYLFTLLRMKRPGA
jgi:hypothetical protein